MFRFQVHRLLGWGRGPCKEVYVEAKVPVIGLALVISGICLVVGYLESFFVSLGAWSLESSVSFEVTLNAHER